MYLCVKGFDLVSFYDCFIDILKCSDIVVFFYWFFSYFNTQKVVIKYIDNLITLLYFRFVLRKLF
jgi:hypothetical protein